MKDALGHGSDAHQTGVNQVGVRFGDETRYQNHVIRVVGRMGVPVFTVFGPKNHTGGNPYIGESPTMLGAKALIDQQSLRT